MHDTLMNTKDKFHLVQSLKKQIRGIHEVRKGYTRFMEHEIERSHGIGADTKEILLNECRELNGFNKGIYNFLEHEADRLSEFPELKFYKFSNSK